jgi:hypothetical protein
MTDTIKDVEIGSYVEMTWKPGYFFLVVGIPSEHEVDGDDIIIIHENGVYFTKKDFEDDRFIRYFKIGLDYLPDKILAVGADNILSHSPPAASYGGQIKTVKRKYDNYIFPTTAAPKKKRGFEWL